jgi:hypothetical protein
MLKIWQPCLPATLLSGFIENSERAEDWFQKGLLAPKRKKESVEAAILFFFVPPTEKSGVNNGCPFFCFVNGGHFPADQGDQGSML